MIKSNQAEIQMTALRLQEKQLELQKQNKEILQKVVDKGLPILDKYIHTQLKTVDAPRVRWSIIGFLGILFIIILGSGFLVYSGKLDSGSFTFLLGTLIGASITFLGDTILPKG